MAAGLLSHPLSDGTRYHFQSDTTLEKTGIREGSQPEELGQDRNRTDKGTVFGQGWGPEPREGGEAAAMSGSSAFHGEVTALTRAGCIGCLGPAWRLSIYPFWSPWGLADDSPLALETSTPTWGMWEAVLCSQGRWELLVRHGKNDSYSSGVRLRSG